MAVRQVVLAIVGKRYGNEEIKQPLQFWEVGHQEPQGCTYPIYNRSGPENYGLTKRRHERTLQLNQQRENYTTPVIFHPGQQNTQKGMWDTIPTTVENIVGTIKTAMGKANGSTKI